MSVNGQVRLVCFDLGGVVVRICRSWQEGCIAAGLPVRADLSSDEMKARRRALSDRYQAGLLGCDEFFRLLSESTGGIYTPEEVRRIHAAWTLDVYEGVDNLVGELSRLRSVQLGVLSNTNHAHWEVLCGARRRPEYWSVLSKIHHPHASHLLRLAKPSPDIYLEFQRRTGFAGEHILFFDDLEENILAARRVGWRAEQIDHTGDTAAQMRAHLARHGVLGA